MSISGIPLNSLPAPSMPVTIKAPAIVANPQPLPAVSAPKVVVAPQPVAVQAPEPLRIDPVKMGRQLEEVVSMLNHQMEQTKRGLGFSIDRVAHENVVIVRDTNTGGIVRQIPTQDVLNIAHSIESLKGILYSKLA